MDYKKNFFIFNNRDLLIWLRDGGSNFYQCSVENRLHFIPPMLVDRSLLCPLNPFKLELPQSSIYIKGTIQNTNLQRWQINLVAFIVIHLSLISLTRGWIYAWYSAHSTRRTWVLRGILFRTTRLQFVIETCSLWMSVSFWFLITDGLSTDPL